MLMYSSYTALYASDFALPGRRSLHFQRPVNPSFRTAAGVLGCRTLVL